MEKEIRNTLPVDSVVDSLPEGEVAGLGKMLQGLPVHLRGYYECGEVLQKPDSKVVKATRKCLLVKDGKYDALVGKLLEKRIVELVDEKPVEIDALNAVPKHGNKPCLMLDTRRGNLHLQEPLDP